MVICFPQIRNIPSAYNKHVTGFGSFTAAKYGTRCPAHEYGTPPSVSCRIHAPGISFHTLQPWKTLIPLRLCILTLTLPPVHNARMISWFLWRADNTAIIDPWPRMMDEVASASDIPVATWESPKSGTVTFWINTNYNKFWEFMRWLALIQILTKETLPTWYGKSYSRLLD